ncbi:MAG: hypothetical protein ACRC61_22425, partial [Aeromonas salmonicida]
MKMFKGKKGNWGDWKWVGVWIVIIMISVAIVLGIMLGLGNLEGEKVTRHKRGVSEDLCLKRYGGIELNYTQGSTTSFTFDLCIVIKCGGQNSSYRGYDVYLCATAGFDYACHTTKTVGTRDAVDGLAEQLAPTSLMAVQNRMALDMLLAEKGGVCHMFGDLCCT